VGGAEPHTMTTFTRMPRTTLLIVMSVIILVAELFANEVVAGDEGDGDVGGWIGLSLFGIAVMLVLVLVVIPRIGAGDGRRNAVLGFGIGAVVLNVIFWSALPFALGAAALAAAAPGDDTPEGEGDAPVSAGVILALLAIVAAFILCLVG
jgi:hypothetical protein